MRPDRCKFSLRFDPENYDDNGVNLFIVDMDEVDNDDIREVVHPDFEKFWGNTSENSFESEHFKTIEQAREWCLFIGMIEDAEGFSN